MTIRFPYIPVMVFLTMSLAQSGVVSAQMVVEELEEKESECVRTLENARKTYEDGLIEKVEDMVRDCLSKGNFTKDEKLEAYRLIAMAKMYDNNEAEAEKAMIEFLRIDPEYQIQPGIDPKEFIELYDNYHTSPLYTIGVQFGLNFTQVNSFLERGPYNTETEQKEFNSNLGIQFGAKVSRYIYDGLNVNLDLLYAQNSFSYTQDILEDAEHVSNIENYNMLNIPLTFSYTFRKDKTLKPYIEAGAAMRFLFIASSNPTKEIETLNVNIASSSNDILEKRNSLNFEGVFGAGLKYKIPTGDIYLNFRYTLGFGNQRNTSYEGDINENSDFWNTHVYDNDFSINNMIVSLGYNFYLYKPRKKKVSSRKELDFDEVKSVKDKKEDNEGSKSSTSEPDGKRRIIE